MSDTPSNQQTQWQTTAIQAAAQVERAALASLHQAALAAPDLQMRWREIAGAGMSVAAGGGHILLNRCLDLGIFDTAVKADVERIRDCYREAGVPRYFIHLDEHARPAELPQWLEATGHRRARGWMKFARPAEPAEPVDTALKVARVEPGNAADFGRIAAAGFDLGDNAVPMLAALAEQPGWHLYMSFAGSEPAGTGALFIRDNVAYLDWAATDPKWRGRGSQRALLARRINTAVEAGCKLLVSMTGEQVPGDPQHSYSNLLNAGFRELVLRPNWEPA